MTFKSRVVLASILILIINPITFSDIGTNWSARWIGPVKDAISTNAEQLEDVSWIWVIETVHDSMNNPVFEVFGCDCRHPPAQLFSLAGLLFEDS